MNLIDVTLACEDTKSKIVEIVPVADFDSDKLVDDSLVHSWKLKFGYEIEFLSRVKGLVNTLNLKCSQYFDADPWLRL